MRTAIHYAWTALLAVGLTACSQSDDLGVQSTSAYSDSGVVLTSISSSAGNVGTRFDGDNGYWEDGDALGVFLMNADNSEILNDASNVAFTLSEGAGTNTGTFTNATGITFPEVAAHLFAYTPYTDSEDVIYETTYTLDLSDQSDTETKANDLMWADYSIEEADIDNLESNVEMAFEHMVAKVVIYVTTEDGVSVNSAEIANLNAVGEFSLSGGEFDTESAGTIVPYDASTDDLIAYEAIVLPTTDMSAMTLKFVASTGYTYAWTASNSAITKFEAGYKYTFNIGLGTTPTTSGSSGSNAITSITATGDGFTNNASEVSDEASIWSVAYDYDTSATIIDVDASDNLTTLLSTAASEGYTSVALRFDSDVDFSTAFGTITTPDGITTLMLICDNANGQAAINLTGFSNYSPTLENLYFYNMDITGNGTGTSFIYYGNISGTIEAVSTTFRQMDSVFHLGNNEATTIQAMNFTDCIFLDYSTIVNTLGSTTTITDGINFTNCTIGVTDSSVANNIVYSSGVQNCSITLTDCTVHTLGSIIFRLGFEVDDDGSYSYNTVCLTNCVVANAGSSFTYFVSVASTSAGNYYLPLDSSASDYSSSSYFTSLSDWSGLFGSTEYSGEYYLSSSFVSSYGYCGDPRWYEEESDDDDD